MNREAAAAEIAAGGTLRAGINLSNFLLVTGSAPDGAPVGVGPDFARAIADRLGAEAAYVCYPRPGELADAAETGAWDVGLIGAEPARAAKIAFTPAYVEIEATYLVPAGSPLASVVEVDRPGLRVAVSARSAYDLYLSRSLAQAELVRAEGIDASFDLFVAEGLDALAGLRPALAAQAAKLPGARVLDGRFTAVQQAVGTPRGNEAAAAFLRGFVEEAKASGLVARLIDRHGVAGKLTVAPPA